MPSNLCISLAAISAWWGISMSVVFCKFCIGVQEEPENLPQDRHFPYKDFNKHRHMFTRTESSDNIETLDHTESLDNTKNIRERPSIETMETSYPDTCKTHRNVITITPHCELNKIIDVNDSDDLYEFI